VSNTAEQSQKSQAEQEAFAAVSRAAALMGWARVLLQSLSPDDCVAVAVHAFGVLGAERDPDAPPLAPDLARVCDVCRAVVEGLGEAAPAPSEDALWALDGLDAYALHGVDAPRSVGQIAEVMLRYVTEGERMFIRKVWNINGSNVEATENDLWCAISSPVARPSETALSAAQYALGHYMQHLADPSVAPS
jgi:hypothetical protein